MFSSLRLARVVEKIRKLPIRRSHVIGIDLGTTNSCVSIMEGQSPRVIEDSEGNRTTPSVVAITDSGDILVGHPARRQRISNPQNTFYATKRLIGRRFTDPDVQRELSNFAFTVVMGKNEEASMCANSKVYSPTDVASLILKRMKEIAENYLKTDVSKCVITVPAYFNDSQRQATKAAGKMIGLDVLRIINEPTAAALAYGLDKSNDKIVATYDLGGGTFDVSILEIEKGVFEVISTNGDTFLGGEDFDNRILQFFVSYIKDKYGFDATENVIALQRLKESAEAAKIDLSNATEVVVSLPHFFTDSSGPKHVSLEFTRSQMESLVEDLVQRTVLPCQKALLDANLKPFQVKEVILVGGMTRMPKIHEVVESIFGRAPNITVNPDEAIAMGAAIQGAILSGDVSDVLLLDVTPLSLGIETLGGVMTKMIHRNTTIPTKVTQVFTTAVDNQTQVEFRVYQGEKEMVADNILLGEFTLVELPPVPRGLARIEVTFDIDANGIVNVSAKDMKTGKKQEIVVNAKKTTVNREQVEQNQLSDQQKYQLAEVIRQTYSLIEDVEEKVGEFKAKLPTGPTNDVLNLLASTKKKLKQNSEELSVSDVENMAKKIQDITLNLFTNQTSKN
uniref:Uncharacterized protein n=1 Tax=Trichobilharzia regenti TaxID=157069 RepID=A0AA85KLC4_TRIRE|nr:unnamed protein product [Trichobilharzia regenti]